MVTNTATLTTDSGVKTVNPTLATLVLVQTLTVIMVMGGVAMVPAANPVPKLSVALRHGLPMKPLPKELSSNRTSTVAVSISTLTSTHMVHTSCPLGDTRPLFRLTLTE